jgi:hypothetical protein
MFLTIITGIMHCAILMYIKQRNYVRFRVFEGKLFGREKRQGIIEDQLYQRFAVMHSLLP